jgi:5-(carboxyamino)imidazole ribonucleotide synthase
MENLLGDSVQDWTAIAGEPNACLHLYGKREAREGRKMGHVNRVSPL